MRCAHFHLSQTTHVRKRGAGHAREYETGKYVDIPKAAAPMSDRVSGKVENAIGDPPAIHQVAGYHEKGYGDKNKIIKASVHLLHKHQGTDAWRQEKVGQCASKKRQVRWRANNKEENENSKKQSNGETHGAFPPFLKLDHILWIF
jgi:hypothetical protein